MRILGMFLVLIFVSTSLLAAKVDLKKTAGAGVKGGFKGSCYAECRKAGGTLSTPEMCQKACADKLAQ